MTTGKKSDGPWLPRIHIAPPRTALLISLQGLRIFSRTSYNWGFLLTVKDSPPAGFGRWLSSKKNWIKLRGFSSQANYTDRLCGLVVRVPAYRSRGPGFDSRRYQIFWEVERGPLSLVSVTTWMEIGWNRRPKLTSVGIRCADHATPFYPQKLAITCRQAAVARSV
jgi:hypothetical protein